MGPAGARRIEHAPVDAVRPRGEGRAARSTASERAAREAGFDRVPVPPTYTFVMSRLGRVPRPPARGRDGLDVREPRAATRRARSPATACTCTASSTSRTTGRSASATCSKAGCARRSRSRARRGAGRWKSRTSRRRGPTPTARPSSTSRSCRSSSRTADARERGGPPVGSIRVSGSANRWRRGVRSRRRARVVLLAVRLHDVEAVHVLTGASPAFLSPVHV